MVRKMKTHHYNAVVHPVVFDASSIDMKAADDNYRVRRKEPFEALPDAEDKKSNAEMIFSFFFHVAFLPVRILCLPCNPPTPLDRFSEAVLYSATQACCPRI